MAIREKSITSQGRMSGESGCPNSPVSLVLAKLAASHIREEMKNPHQVTVYDPACGVMESSLRLAESVISNDSGVTQLMLHCSDIHPEAIRNAARRLVLRNLPNTVFVERSRKSATTRKFSSPARGMSCWSRSARSRPSSTAREVIASPET